jgi:hypothetical protein
MNRREELTAAAEANAGFAPAVVDGIAQKFAWPGGYPIGYIVDDGETLCADCVNDPSNPVHFEGDRDGWLIWGFQVYEGSAEDYDGAVVCAHCGAVLVEPCSPENDEAMAEEAQRTTDRDPSDSDEDKMRRAGAEHGRAVASWYFDGNTDRATYARTLRGIEEGDPEILDTLPSAPLSGEWADEPTPASVFRDVLEADEAEYDERGESDDLLTAYEEAFSTAAADAIEAAARAQLAP